jgi:lysyl-tRNA synthetase class 2
MSIHPTWRKLKEHQELWDRYFVREKVITAIRRFFLDQRFHEIETPCLTGSLPPESYLDVFETDLLSRTRSVTKAYLPTSPEPFLKKLLVAGVGNCFAITKSFRNTEDMSKTHNPEFTILEWYRTPADYTDIMADCEDLIRFIHTYLVRTRIQNRSVSVPGGAGTDSRGFLEALTYQGTAVDLSKPWERITVSDAFRRYAGIDDSSLLDRSLLAEHARNRGYAVTDSDSWEEIFDQIFLNEVEPKLGRGRPTIIYDYPAELAALAKVKGPDPRWAERFEFYIEGLELGDAYSELTDWKEQEERFIGEQEERRRLGKTLHPVDTDFIDALKAGMPETGGIAVGVDRLVMLFADVTDISDTLLFPAKDLFRIRSDEDS